MTRRWSSSDENLTHAQSALMAIEGTDGVGGDLVELSIDGLRCVARICVHSEEHQRRERLGLGAVTDTGLLHALWSLPEDLSFAWEELDPLDTATLQQLGAGHLISDDRATVRSYRSPAVVNTVLSVAGTAKDAIRRIGQFPPIFVRVAVVISAAARWDRYLELAEQLGIGVVVDTAEAGDTKIMKLPAPLTVGVPSVYRWWISELAYRNWRYRNCAH